jgi:hypothetical protein
MLKFYKNKLFLPIIATVISVIGLTTGSILVQQRQVLEQEAAPATSLTITSTTNSPVINEQFTMSVNIASGVNAISGAQLYISYNPAVINVTDVSLGGFLSGATIFQKTIDNSQGLITYVILMPPGSSYPSGNGVVAKINAYGASVGTSVVAVDAKTQISAAGEGQNVLTSTVPTTIYVQDNGPVVTPRLSPTITLKPSVTVKPTATVTPRATVTSKPSSTVTPRPTASVTPRPTATLTPKPTATLTPKPTVTLRPSSTITPKLSITTEPSVSSRPSTTPRLTVTGRPSPTPCSSYAGSSYPSNMVVKLGDLVKGNLESLTSADKNVVEISPFKFEDWFSQIWNSFFGRARMIAVQFDGQLNGYTYASSQYVTITIVGSSTRNSYSGVSLFNYSKNKYVKVRTIRMNEETNTYAFKVNTKDVVDSSGKINMVISAYDNHDFNLSIDYVNWSINANNCYNHNHD